MEIPVEKGQSWVVLFTTPTWGWAAVGEVMVDLSGKNYWSGGKQGSLGDTGMALCQLWGFGNAWRGQGGTGPVWVAQGCRMSLISQGEEQVWPELPDQHHFQGVYGTQRVSGMSKQLWLCSSSWEAQSRICHGKDLPLLSALQQG